VSPDGRRDLGALGERYAEAHLARAGYRIVERNFRTRAGELDLIVRGEGCLVFCEVRARVGARSPRRGGAGPGGPLDSIGWDKRRRLRRMAREWLALRPGAGDGAGELRFDAIGVTLDVTGSLVNLEHVEDAF
jgi:putative endonuclease